MGIEGPRRAVRGFEHAIRITRGKLARAGFWERFTSWALWGWLAAGAVLLIGKLTWAPVSLAGAGLALLCPLVALAAARRGTRTLSKTHAAVLLDRKGELQGFPLLYLAYPDSPWIERATEQARKAGSAVPELAAGRFLKRLAPGLLFLGLTLFLPQQEGVFGIVARKRHSAAGRELERLSEEVEALQETELFGEEELDRLKEELAALEETTATREVGQEVWEGLDYLSEQLHQSAREKAARMKAARCAAGGMSDALNEGLDEAAQREKREALERALAQLGAGGLPQELQEQLRQLQEGGQQGSPGASVDPQSLRNALQELQDFLDQQLQEVTGLVEGLEGNAGGG